MTTEEHASPSVVTMTEQEAKLVASLLKLYDSSWDKGGCRQNCACAWCNAVDKAGDHTTAVFSNLKLKVEPYQ
jgi:hypothetical protein